MFHGGMPVESEAEGTLLLVLLEIPPRAVPAGAEGYPVTRSIWAVAYTGSDGSLRYVGYGPCNIPILHESKRAAELDARCLREQSKGYLDEHAVRVKVSLEGIYP